VDPLTKKLVKFEILESKDLIASAQFTINEKLPYFSGHFPNDPILPAVSIIDISLYFLNFIGHPFSYSNITVRKSKFMGKVLPNHKILISVLGNPSKEWQINWTSLSDSTKLASISLSENV
jgi:3-hydroxymyristoyl/3-hydroxydecanoyl-(acyl carrier protein) dehydratase